MISTGLRLTGAVSLALLTPMAMPAASIDKSSNTTAIFANQEQKQPAKKKVAASGVNRTPSATRTRQTSTVRAS